MLAGQAIEIGFPLYDIGEGGRLFLQALRDAAYHFRYAACHITYLAYGVAGRVDQFNPARPLDAGYYIQGGALYGLGNL